jgi:hypothetical protein
MLTIGGAGAMRACCGAQAVFTHESRHQLAPTTRSFSSQDGMNDLDYLSILISKREFETQEPGSGGTSP